MWNGKILRAKCKAFMLVAKRPNVQNAPIIIKN
jgi:hypothetical protein